MRWLPRQISEVLSVSISYTYIVYLYYIYIIYLSSSSVVNAHYRSVSRTLRAPCDVDEQKIITTSLQISAAELSHSHHEFQFAKVCGSCMVSRVLPVALAVSSIHPGSPCLLLLFRCLQTRETIHAVCRGPVCRGFLGECLHACLGCACMSEAHFLSACCRNVRLEWVTGCPVLGG